MHAGAAAEADLQDTAGDHSGVGDQIDHRAADVLGSQPWLRYRIGFHHAAHQVVGDVVTAGGLHHRCLRRGGADDVDRDAVFGDLQGSGLGEADDTPFGGVVGGQLGDAKLGLEDEHILANPELYGLRRSVCYRQW